MEQVQIAKVLVSLGCPPEKSEGMAAQLLRRAVQLAREKNRTPEQAMAHLLQLMSQGWASAASGSTTSGLGSAPAASSSS